ncbi:hypothetical protein [Myroides sp. DF42-4-2]|uniref:hypothetical protein n=1 Tax=unclassified Myroides TaxID=2642485 RepID=UPI0025769CD7|nr:hypothetical protein [Myroides sp. DF42-4-2]MDM1408753.1 hypothetical protein [Myroides sp. DF42-4-2]
MKLELFEEVQSKLTHFVRHFVKITPYGNLNSLAFQHYHYNNFKAMTSTLFEALLHINYAQLQKSEDKITYSTPFSLTLNESQELIREIDFSKIKLDKQRKIRCAVQQEIKEKFSNQPANSYSSISFNCLDRSKQMCALVGTIHISENREYTVNLFYLKIDTQLEDLLLDFNYYLKDKNKHLCIYNTLLESETAHDIKLLSLLQQQQLSPEDFEENFIYFFGDTLLDYQKKERFLKSLELLLFSPNSMEEIAKTCEKKRTPYTLSQFFNSARSSRNNAVIRYNVG